MVRFFLAEGLVVGWEKEMAWGRGATVVLFLDGGPGSRHGDRLGEYMNMPLVITAFGIFDFSVLISTISIQYC